MHIGPRVYAPSPYLRVVWGVRKRHFPGYEGFLPFLWHTWHRQACAQAELIVPAACDPAIATRAKRKQRSTSRTLKM